MNVLKPRRKLTFTRETLRRLDDQELDAAVGGVGRTWNSENVACSSVVVYTLTLHTAVPRCNPAC
jgi:hypothetical protein